MTNFLSEMYQVWARQTRNWRSIVIYQTITRFLFRLTEQYATVFIRMLGASPVQLGLITGTAGIAMTACALPLGYLQDRFSLRRLFLAGASLVVISPLFYAIAPSWKWAAPAIILYALGRRFGSCAVICDLSLPTCDRATGKSMCEGVGALPTVLAPGLAAAMVMWMGGVSILSIRILFFIQLAVGVLIYLRLVRTLTEIPRERSPLPVQKPLAGYLEVIAGKPVLYRYIAFTVLMWFTYTMTLTFLYPYLFEIKGQSAFLLGAAATAMTLAEAAFAVPLGRLADRIGRRVVFALLTPFAVVSSLLLVWASAHWLLIVGAFLLGFRLIADVVQSAITPELVPSHQLGRWRGLVSLAMGLAAIPAPIVGGFLWEYAGAGSVFWIAAIIDVALILPLLLSIPETLHASH